MREENYHLKILAKGATWGISISINAAFIIDSCVLENYLKVTDRIFIDNTTSFKFPQEDQKFFFNGIIDYEKVICKNLPAKSNVIIRINELIFGLTDLQAEGFYYVIVGWLSKILNFDTPPINFTFDKLHNKYLFDLKVN